MKRMICIVNQVKVISGTSGISYTIDIVITQNFITNTSLAQAFINGQFACQGLLLTSFFF